MKVLCPQPLTREAHNFSMWPKGYNKPQGQRIKPMVQRRSLRERTITDVSDKGLVQAPLPSSLSSHDTVSFSPLNSQSGSSRITRRRMSSLLTTKDTCHFLPDPLWCLGDLFISQVNYILNHFSPFVNQSRKSGNPISWLVEITSKTRMSGQGSFHFQIIAQNASALTRLGQGRGSELVSISCTLVNVLQYRLAIFEVLKTAQDAP